MAVFKCPDCGGLTESYRTCRGCQTRYCRACVSGRPQRCVVCTSSTFVGRECARTRCTELATHFTWKFLDQRETQPLPLCGRHAEQKSETYSLRLIRLREGV